MKYIERFLNWLNYSPAEALLIGLGWGLSIGLLTANAKAEAKECYLSHDQSGTVFVDCRIGAVPPEYKRICPMVDGEKDGSVYTVNIVEVPDGFIGQLLDLIGLGNSRPWSPGAVLADNEQIVCAMDPAKVQAKADAQAAREAAEQARQAASQARKANAKTICANQPDASPIKALCEAVFDEDL